ncbi:MAG: immunity 22 family protein [Thermotaleaceae bacterium]
MREVEQKSYTYSNDEYVSVFVGNCKSQKLLNEYMKKDYELLEVDCIGSEFGVDFGVNTYDEDFLVAISNMPPSKSLEEIFAQTDIFYIEKLKANYPNGLDDFYNTAIVVGKLKYEGDIKDVQNNEFGCFRFLATFSEE